MTHVKISNYMMNNNKLAAVLSWLLTTVEAFYCGHQWDWPN